MNKILFTLMALLLGFQTFGQPQVRKATDAEVAAGLDVSAYVNPKTYQDNLAGAGGPTNGVTATTSTNIAQSVSNTTSNRLWQSTTNFLQAGTSNANMASVTSPNFTGNAANLTNLANANIVLSGSNITIAYSTNAATGKITAMIAVSDPISVSTANVLNLNATNVVNLAATNGANQTNFVMLNTNGGFQFGIFDPATFAWNATTRTLSVTGSGTTPNGLVTNGGPQNVVVTNAGVNTTITSNSVTTGTITANGGSTNTFTGYNWFTNNYAPVIISTSVGAGGTSYTNVTGCRASLVLPYYIQYSATGTPAGTVSNRMTGKKFVVGGNYSGTFNSTNVIILPPCSTNEVWDVRNESTGSGASFGFSGTANLDWYLVP
jgi:hypothetical protein